MTVIRAASSSTTAAVTARLTYSSHSSTSTEAAVSTNVPSTCCRLVLTLSPFAPAASGPVSFGFCEVMDVSPASSGWAWSPATPARLTGSTHCRYSGPP